MLKTFSALNSDPEYLGSDATFQPETVLGITRDGEEITLKNCIRSNYSTKVKGSTTIDSSSLQAVTLFVGAHFGDSTAYFDKVRVSFPLLGEWANISGISYSGGIFEGESTNVSAGDKVNIEYEFLESEKANVDEIEVKFGISADIDKSASGRASLEENHYSEITPDDGQISYEEATEHVENLQDFITLATNKEVTPSLIERRMERENNPGYHSVEIFSTSVDGPKTPTSLHPYHANFLFTDIRENFTEVMNSWFENSDRLSSVYNLYFGSLYNSNMYLQNKFLSLTQAIESYHRDEEEGEYLSDEEFEEFYNQMVTEIPEDLPQSFKDHIKFGTLKHSNEFSLRKRLTEIVSNENEIVSSLPWEIEEKIEIIINTRNYLTHYDEDIQPRADTDEMYELVLILRALLEVTLLREVGIQEDQISNRVTMRYNQLA